MIREHLEAHIAPDRYGRALATLDGGIGEGAELHEADARRLARLFGQLADRLAGPVPDVRVHGPRGLAVTLIDDPAPAENATR